MEALNRLFDYMDSLFPDEVRQRAERNVARMSEVELRSGVTINVDQLHHAAKPGDVFKFGYIHQDGRPNPGKITDVVAVYQGVEDGFYKHRMTANPRSRVGTHIHEQGNDERYEVTKGTMHVYVDTVRVAVLTKDSDSLTIDGARPHSITFPDQETDVDLYIEKLV